MKKSFKGTFVKPAAVAMASVMIAAAGLTACGGSGAGDTTAAVETTAPMTEAPTETPTETQAGIESQPVAGSEEGGSEGTLTADPKQSDETPIPEGDNKAREAGDEAGETAQ